VKKRNRTRDGKRRTAPEAWWLDWGPEVYGWPSHGRATVAIRAVVSVCVVVVLLVMGSSTIYALMLETKQVATSAWHTPQIDDASLGADEETGVSDELKLARESVDWITFAAMFNEFQWLVASGLMAEQP
jgi:hypothetical protein